MAWCEDQGIDYVFGLPGNDLLRAKVEAAADDIRTRRAEEQAVVRRGYTETTYAARSWNKQRRAVARIEAATDAIGAPTVSSASTKDRPRPLLAPVTKAVEPLIFVFDASMVNPENLLPGPDAPDQRSIGAMTSRRLPQGSAKKARRNPNTATSWGSLMILT
jgi:Transposase DDE domain group 1